MSRPITYERIHHTTNGEDEHMTLGHTVFYCVKYRDKIVALGQKIANRKWGGIKYRPLFGTSRKTLQNHCDRFNDVFNSTEYRVVEVRSEMLD